MLRWILLMGLTYVAYGLHISFKDCGPIHSYMPDEVFLDVNCKKEPCYLYLGRQTNMTVSFKSNNITTEDFTAESYLTVGGYKQKIEITPNKCPKHVCPIKANESKKFSVLMKPNFIAPNYPDTSNAAYLDPQFKDPELQLSQPLSQPKQASLGEDQITGLSDNKKIKPKKEKAWIKGRKGKYNKKTKEYWMKKKNM